MPTAWLIDVYKRQLIDLLDTLGYGPQVWKFDEQDDEELAALLSMQQSRFIRAMANA